MDVAWRIHLDVAWRIDNRDYIQNDTAHTTSS